MRTTWRSPILVHRTALTAIALLAAATAPAAIARTAPAIGAADAPLQTSGLEDRYIVVLKPSAAPSAQAALVRRAIAGGASISHRYHDALDGFAGTFPPAALAAVRDDRDVDYVEADKAIELSSTQTPVTWGLDRIDQPDLPLDDSYTTDVVGAGEATGRGVKVYVIDTDIATSYPGFTNRASMGYGSGGGCWQHGTHVASMIGSVTYGVAKDVTLVGVQVTDCWQGPALSETLTGIDWVTNDHQAGQPAVANMSLNVQGLSESAPAGASPVLDQAVETSIADGITYVAAAGGRDADACGVSPGRVGRVLTVGATNSSDRRWLDATDPQVGSNVGPCVDLFAPGVDIVSDGISPTSTLTGTMTGTSAAAAHVSGVAAQYLQAHPCAPPSQVGRALLQMSTPNKVIDPGPGSPNLLLRGSVTMPCWVICEQES
jgi:subtilisin family serine protease